MTDEKDKKDNVVVGPWGDNPVDNNGEWVKEKYDKALDKNNTQLRMQDKLAQKTDWDRVPGTPKGHHQYRPRKKGW